jgi:hypothetical protein
MAEIVYTYQEPAQEFMPYGKLMRWWESEEDMSQRSQAKAAEERLEAASGWMKIMKTYATSG